MADHTYKIKKDFNDKNLDITLNSTFKKILNMEQQKYNNKKNIAVESYTSDSVTNNQLYTNKPDAQTNMANNKKIAFSSIVE